MDFQVCTVNKKRKECGHCLALGDQLLSAVRKITDPQENKYEGTQSLLIFQSQSSFLESSLYSESVEIRNDF